MQEEEIITRIIAVVNSSEIFYAITMQ